MDDVRKLLHEFADRSVEGLPTADVEADVARGKRMLKRIRRRRRVTGVLCVAAATVAVVAIGQAGWWRSGGTEVATAPTGTAAPGASTELATPSVLASPRGPATMSSYSTGLRLVTNREPWRDIGCTLIPEGWTPQHPIGAGQVVLTPPSVRTSAETDQLVLRKVRTPPQLREVSVSQADGKVLQLGQLGQRQAGQIKLGTDWLLAELPVADEGWTADQLLAFLASCRFN